jgi:hypothetical protein
VLTLGFSCAWAEEPGGFTPDEADRRMIIPEGFVAEQIVRQPLSASFDERGRLWVIE